MIKSAAQRVAERFAAQELPVVASHTCPFCGAGYTSQCRCPRSDMECQNGHEWHHDGEFIHAGRSDHASPKCCEGGPIAVVADEGLV